MKREQERERWRGRGKEEEEWGDEGRMGEGEE